MRTGEQRESVQSAIRAPADNKAGAFCMADNSTYLVDDFVNTQIGTPFRLFPFGTLVKNGVKREITPELAAKFTLPHFKPPIKLGSHEETTAAGGHIDSLLVKDDGLYAMPEWNDQGGASLERGDYRYHSPEVIWPGGALENPHDGSLIEGPLIVGTALLHMPHLGEDAKLYGIQKPTPKKELDTMTEETVSVPKSFLDNFFARFAPQEQVTAEFIEPVIVTESDEFKAVAKERDDLAAEIQEQKDALVKQKLHAGIVSNLQNEDLFGMNYIELTEAQDAADMLATMSEDQRDWVTRHFKAFIAQIDESTLTGEDGSSAEGSDNPAAEFNAAVKAIQAEQKVSYGQAVQIATGEKPELFAAYRKAQKGA